MSQRFQQLNLEGLNDSARSNDAEFVFEDNGNGNKVFPEDRAFHDWYRFVLSFPPHLVDYYINQFNIRQGNMVLDPFCGTGTTMVQAKKRGINSTGIEANPIACFASQVKTDWTISPKALLDCALEISRITLSEFAQQGIDDFSADALDPVRAPLRTLNDDQKKLILENSISPLPLHKALMLLDQIKKFQNEPCYRYLQLAYAKALVFSISNLSFGPEVGVGRQKTNTPVVAPWITQVRQMANDLQSLNQNPGPGSNILLADSRHVDRVIPHQSIDAVITSPPYPNEKDYSRTTRLESVLLGFINNKDELRNLKKNLVRSNTRGVYKEDDDDVLVKDNQEIQRLFEAIEQRRIELHKTSGFEKLYGRVTRLYFGGMLRHLISLQPVLKPGARLAYVVGDQASYLRVMIRTGKILAELAQQVGFDLVRIDLFRKRFATATRAELREEVVILKWKGE